MLKKTLSLLVLAGLIATANLSILAQTQSSELKNFQQPNTPSKKEFLDKLGVSPADRAAELLNNDSFVKVKEDSVTAKTMQDADKAQQKKKFAGMNTTTAVVIGAALAAAIIIVLATRGDNDRDSGNVQCVRAPCP